MADAHGLGFELDEAELLAFVTAQRWFGAKSRRPVGALIVAAPLARSAAPLLALAIVEVRYVGGPPELYHLPLGFRTAGERWSRGVVSEVGGWTAYDALGDPELVRELARLIGTDAALGELEFRNVVEVPEPHHVSPIEAEQSNSSLVLDERSVLKVYRRLAPGTNPELELLRFLSAHGFPGAPSLQGWVEVRGAPLRATLAILRRYVRSEGDGWSIALDSLAGDPDPFIGRLRSLGELTGAMHALLAAAPFSAEELTQDALDRIAADVDAEVVSLFGRLPDEPALQPIAGRADDLRARLRSIARLDTPGQVIRSHGDFHLGQVLSEGTGWVVIDFEGEPARSLPERRRKHSPLRDVAGMLRSFAYAASASRVEPPGGWEQRARGAFLEGYRAEVDGTIVPPPGQFERLLALFELEKAVYELGYELDHRPDWVAIPVAGISRLLSQSSTSS